jgi:predicted permease
MTNILISLLPILIITIMGYVFRRAQMFDGDFWPQAERLTYFVLLPCLFFLLTFKADLSDENLIHAPFLLAGIIIFITVIMLLLRKFISSNEPAFTSLYQGAIRFNGYMLIPSSLMMFGESGGAITAIVISVIVPIVNFLCVYVLARYGNHKTVNFKSVVIRFLKNPFIISCLLGSVFNYYGVNLPVFATDTLDIMSNAALPIGLLCVGAGLDFSQIRSVPKELVASCLIKLVIYPLLVVLVGLGLHVDRLIIQICLLFAIMPSATASYLMAKQMGGDAPLMANIIMVQTALSIVTMPVGLLLFDWLL